MKHELQHYGDNRLLNRGGKATHQHMRQSLAAQRIATAYDGVRAVYGNKAMDKTTHQDTQPRTNAHQGAGNGTTHDPNHGGIT